MVRKFFIAATLATVSISLAACATVRGVGQDIESVANDVDEAT